MWGVQARADAAEQRAAVLADEVRLAQQQAEERGGALEKLLGEKVGSEQQARQLHEQLKKEKAEEQGRMQQAADGLQETVRALRLQYDDMALQLDIANKEGRSLQVGWKRGHAAHEHPCKHRTCIVSLY